MLVLLDEAGCPVAYNAHPWDRLMVRLRALRLDRDLAAGASPEASGALALRAQMLVRTQHRRDLADNARRVLAKATQPGFSGRAPVCGDRVGDCREEFGELIRRLLATGPVPVRGVAKVGVLLADGTGPLYDRCSAEDLRVQVRDAADALIAA